MRKEKNDFFEADGRTAWLWRNRTKTQKRMFDTEAECRTWVARANSAKAGNLEI